MSDKIYLKQLEQFGIESSVRIPSEDEKKKHNENLQVSLKVVKYLMGEMEGRQWMWNKLDMCGVFTAPFAPGKPDVSAVLTGIQAVGHTLLADIMQASPENFYVMIQEANARKAAKD